MKKCSEDNMGGVNNLHPSFIRFKSIQSNIAVAFLCLILVTILVIAFMSYNMTSEAVENNSREYSNQLVQQVNTNIESYITYMENISQIMVYNYDVREYLSRQSFSSSRELENLEEKIYNQLNSLRNARSDISSIIIFGSNGRRISNSKFLKLNPNIDPKEQTWYKKAVEADGKISISPSHVQNIVDGEYRWVVSLSREISVNNRSEELGVLLVDLNYSVINDICSSVKLGKRGYIFIVDEDGNIIYHPQQQLIYSNLKTELIDQVLKAKSGSFITKEGQNSKIYTITQSSHTGWKIVGVTYTGELVSNKLEIQIYYLLGGIGFLLIAIVLSIVISLRLTRPIRQLEASMKEVEKGNFDAKVDIKNPNEIGQLSKSFNIMTEKIKELMQQILKAQEQKRMSELKALQAQINPHFLYNTLDSIIWMAESKKSEEVVLMTSALAKLFRLSISKGEEMITIFNEIEHVKNYLTIQKMRYRDKLDFVINVDEFILTKKILKIILQPLVENAIYHGIKNNMGVGIVKITGKQVENKILLQVADNGIGMTPEKVENIFEKNATSGKESGVGVRNVNDRIKLYFGDEYGLVYESNPAKGTIVNIWLPVLE